MHPTTPTFRRSAANRPPRVVLLLALALLATCRRAPPPYLSEPPAYWPTEGWRASSPESQGIDSGRLADLVRSIRTRGLGVHGVLVVRGAHVVLDASFFPYRSDGLHDVASVTKSVTATLVGIALREGLIPDVRRPMLDLLPGRRPAAPGKEEITVEHLLTMTSGIGCGRAPAGEMEQALAMMRSPDWIQFALDAPTAAPPGSAFAYCNPNYHLLSAVLTQVAGESALAFARDRLFEPLGIRDAAWPADPQGVSHGWGDLHLHPRDLAKIGLLYLHGGTWDGKRILEGGWIAASTSGQVPLQGGGAYGYGWWPGTGRYQGVHVARGRGGQILAVSPALDLVVVLTGGGYPLDEVAEALLGAVRPERRLPENPSAAERLRVEVEEAAAPPKASSPPPLPDVARRISGRTWALEANPLGLRTLTLTFEGDREAAAVLRSDQGDFTFRIGLDGVPRLSPGGRFGLSVAAAGGWRQDRFDLDFDEVANINRFRLSASWEAGGISLRVEERSGLVPPHEIRGREGSVAW